MKTSINGALLHESGPPKENPQVGKNLGVRNNRWLEKLQMQDSSSDARFQLQLTFTPRKGDSTSLTHKTLSDEQLTRLLAVHIVGEKDGDALIPAVFRPCPDECRNSRGGVDCGGGALHRLDNNVEAMTALGLDLDDISDADFARALADLKVKGVRCWWWHTHGYDPQSGSVRARLLLPFKEPMPLEHSIQWRSWAWPALVAHLGLEELTDPACSNAGRVYFTPRKPSGDSPHRAGSLDGAPLDWRAAIGPVPRSLPPPSCPVPFPAGLSVTDSARQQIRDEIAQYDQAIAHHRGDDLTYRLGAMLCRDWALTLDQALEFAREWNAQNVPPWSEAELVEIIDHGARFAKGALGSARLRHDPLGVARALVDAYGALPAPQKTEDRQKELVEQVRILVRDYFNDPLDRDRIETDLMTVTEKSKSALGLPRVRRHYKIATAEGSDVAPTEDAVAVLFEQEFGDRLKFCKAWNAWLEWRGDRWEREGTDKTLDFCRALARSANIERKAAMAKATFARGVEAFARASRTFATLPEQWDANPWMLNTPSGVIDLQTGKMRDHRQGDLLTRITQVAPKAGPTPVFDRFMLQICCNDTELVAYHQRSLGATLSGALSDHWMLFWTGSGSNGKNTLGDLVEWILGSYAKTIPIETLMAAKHERHPTDMANLMGIRLAVSSEVPEGSHWNEARLKSMTGDATISARFMRGDFFEFSRTHKHLIYGNHRPQLRVVDEAMRRRLHIVPFKATFSDDAGNKDPNLPQKLRAEAPAIFAWLVEGHRRWLQDGCLRRCEVVKRETDDYLDAQSTPEMWISERCDVTKEGQEKASKLYQDFASWKARRGETAMSQTRWGEWMVSRYKRAKTGGVMHYAGVALKPFEGIQ